MANKKNKNKCILKSDQPKENEVSKNSACEALIDAIAVIDKHALKTWLKKSNEPGSLEVLLKAIDLGHLDNLNTLLGHKSFKNILKSHYATCVFHAFKQNNDSVLPSVINQVTKLVLKQNMASVKEALVTLSFFSGKNLVELTPLHIAIEAGDLDLVKKLVEYGADITVTDHNDRSVIAYAIERQEQVIFDYLYGLGKFDAVALYDHAIKVNNVPVMTYLKKQIDIHNHSYSFIHTSLRHNQIKMIPLLIHHGVKLGDDFKDAQWFIRQISTENLRRNIPVYHALIYMCLNYKKMDLNHTISCVKGIDGYESFVKKINSQYQALESKQWKTLFTWHKSGELFIERAVIEALIANKDLINQPTQLQLFFDLLNQDKHFIYLLKAKVFMNLPSSNDEAPLIIKLKCFIFSYIRTACKLNTIFSKIPEPLFSYIDDDPINVIKAINPVLEMPLVKFKDNKASLFDSKQKEVCQALSQLKISG